MTDRPRITIPFGGGIDRESGILGTDARSMAELFNVHLLNQRVEGRKGLGRVATFDAGLLLLNVHPVRSRSLAAYLLFEEDDHDLHLWQSAADGSGATELTVIDGAEVTGRANYVLADIYDKLFIAHDEPDILLRQPTRYWDFATASLHTILVPQFGGTIAKFRGVASHLAYMLGWGWGLGGDEDRPETLRISLPGEPTKFDPNHYFLVGLRGEPITGGGATGRTWAVKKLTHGHTLIGSNRANFDVLPIEDHVGLERHNLGISVNGVYYFWSGEGPRRESGGQSEDLSSGLRLLDPPPAGFMATTTNLGFATYDPTRKEILFVFERWAYVLHLDANPERWSYREYGVAASCGAVLVESTTGALVVPPDAGYDFTLDPIGVTDEGPPDEGYLFTIDPIGVAPVASIAPLDDLIAAFGDDGIEGIYIADRGVALAGADFTWEDGRGPGFGVDLTATGVAAPDITAPTVHFDGFDHVLDDYTVPVSDGFAYLACYRQEDLGSGFAPLLLSVIDLGDNLAVPRLGTSAGATFDGDISAPAPAGWMAIGYRVLAGVNQNGQGYDGPTRLADCTTKLAQLAAATPATFALGTWGSFPDQKFMGDLFALVLLSRLPSDVEMAAAYDALKVIAAAALIAVVN